MFKKLLLLCSAILIMTSVGDAKEIAGVNMPETLAAGSDTLVLNGAGVRTYFIEVYAAGLFLKKKNGDANAIINADETMAIRLHILTEAITSENIKIVFLEGFQKYNNGNTAPLKDKIDTFISAFNDNINPNDVYDFIYIPAEGLKVYKNKELKNTTKGLDFKKAIFRIWLCEKPSDEDKKALKESMLSGK
jgi:hypothetical protein